MGHKHVPEMTVHAGLAYPPLFAPAVVAAHRGMMVEVPLQLVAMNKAGSAGALRAALSEFYAGSPIVKVEADAPGELLLRGSMAPVDTLTLRVFGAADRSEEHTSELPSLMRISFAVFCL